MKQLRFALRALGRDIRAGELRVLALALIVAVASVTAVGFFTDRIGRAMERQAADVLAADLKVRAGQPIPDSILNKADELGLSTATLLEFPTVVLTDDDESQLVAVKAVTDAYPLRGRLQLYTLDAPLSEAPLETPAPGTVWVDQQLVNALALEQGSTLALGSRQYSVARVIAFEPDRGENPFQLAPRLMLNMQDMEGSELLGEGSRLRYALLLAGDNRAITDIAGWIDDNEGENVTVQSVRDGSRQVRQALERADRFLGLAAVVTVLLAGAAIALAVRQFALRQADASAVMRTLGAKRSEVIQWLAWRLILIASGSALIGIAIGWVAQLVLADMLKAWFKLSLPEPGLMPPLIGILTAFVTLAGFGLLPIIRAGRVPVTRVLQRDYSGLSPSAWWAFFVGLMAAFVVVYLQSGNWLMTFIVVGGVLAMLSLFALFGRLIISGVRRIAGRKWRLSVAGLQRRASSTVVQLSAFALGIMALLLISIVRVDVLKAWEQDLPEDAPNVFLVNIQPPQAEPLRAQLEGEGIEVPGLYPLVRARLVEHNDTSLLAEEDADAHQKRHARFEYNLSWSNVLPPSNTIVEGEWWAEDGSAPPYLSLEKDWAEHLGYKIGDKLTFRVAGEDVTGEIRNFREVDWESFDVNFFAIGSTSLLEKLPHTYITSLHLEEQFSSAASRWVKAFPGVVTLDVGAIIQRVKSLMDRAALAVEYVFMFTLAAGVVVLLAAVQSSQSERIRESALLRALGASHAQIRRTVVVEFAILGAISGFLAALFATIVAWALSTFVLELPFRLNPWLWVFGVVAGTVGISLAGYLATRKVLSTPPLVALRQT